MKQFNFRKTVHRNGFTTIFGRIGARNVVTRQKGKRLVTSKRFKMQWLRRGNQGWRNQTYGRLNALKIRIMFGRLRSVPDFRR